MVSPNQSGSRPDGFCVNQLLAINHETYKLLDEEFEVRGVFLDISKTFDKVCHEGLLLKYLEITSWNGVSGNLSKVYRNFLYCGKQRQVLNEQHSS